MVGTRFPRDAGGTRRDRVFGLTSRSGDSDPDALDTRAQGLFVQWLDGDERTRPDIEVLCRGDLALERRLRSLINAASGVFDALASLGPGPARSPLPERIGEFRIVDRLGQGGMGQVFLAVQESLGRAVALKVLGDLRSRDGSAAERFRREARTAASLEHPNIVPILAIGEEDGQAFIAMKYLSGPGLDRILGTLPPREVAKLGASVARALDAAHLAGVVHRDVKPANIIFDGEAPVLVDFGLAKTLGEAALTKTGAVAGTLPFMAPEQLQRGQPRVEPRTDVYALGATLYQVATGRLPFPEDDPERLLRAIVSDPPPRLGLEASDRDFEAVVLRALEKEPSRRFSTALEFAEDLERVARGEPIRSRAVGRIGRASRWLRRNRKIAIVSAVSLGIVTTILTVWAVQSLEVRAALRRTLAAARDAVRRGDLDLAEGLAEEATRRASRHDDVLALVAEVRARRALEALLDQLQDRAAAQSADALEKVVRQLDSTVAATIEPRRSRVAVALAHLLRGDKTNARGLLLALRNDPPPIGGPGRDLDAALAAATSTAVVLPAVIDRDPERHVFASLALRAAGSPPDLQLAEIERAITADDRAARPKLAKAIFLADQGRHAEALSAFEGLSTTGIAKSLVRRNRARLHLIRGETREALAQLDALNPDEENSGTRLLRAELLRRSGDEAATDRMIEECLVRNPDDAELLAEAGIVALGRGQGREARRFLERARDLAGSAALRDQAAASLLAIDLAELSGSEDPTAEGTLGAEALGAVARVEAEAASLAANTNHATAKGRALAAGGWAAQLRGDSHLAVERFEAAMAADPDSSSHASNCMAAAVALAADDELSRTERQRLFAVAEAAARAVIVTEGKGVVAPSPSEVDEAYFALAAIACERGDREACRQASEAAKTRFVSSGRTARLPEIEALLAWAIAP